MSLPTPQIAIRHMGHEREPLVIIDGFSGQVEALRAAACTADFAHAGAAYPGLRAKANAGYLDARRAMIMQIIRQTFGFTKGVRLNAAHFSLVTLGAHELIPVQRIPHYDYAGGSVVAMLHYLLGPDSGGTAFYRHRRTGFETVTAGREQTYKAALLQDQQDFGPPPARYCHGDTDWFEMIDEVEARPDRLVLYRGRQLHSGIIPDAAALSSNPGKGRLTVNMFLVGG